MQDQQNGCDLSAVQTKQRTEEKRGKVLTSQLTIGEKRHSFQLNK